MFSKTCVLFLPLLTLAYKDLKGNPKADILKKLTSESQHYLRCYKESVKEKKGKKQQKSQSKRHLNRCKERFPGGYLYLNCRKKAAKIHSKNRNKLNSALKLCQKKQMEYTFTPDNPIPLSSGKKNIIFTGRGFNSPQPLKNFGLLEHNCKGIQEAYKSRSKAEYLLFGQNPKFFAGFQGLSYKQIYKRLRLPKKISSKGYGVPKLGRVFKSAEKPSSIDKLRLNFPSAACHYRSSLGQTYSAISRYYLIDHHQSQLYPYFAIAFYNAEATQSNKATIAKQLLTQLNRSKLGRFKLQKKDKTISYLTSAKISKYDADGDPAQLCKKPRRHKLLGVLKTKEKAENSLEYFLVANIKMLCEYGDFTSRKFLKPNS